MVKMFKSTSDTTESGKNSQSGNNIGTPYFMLVQMNNASLLEAYATLGIQPVVSEIKEKNYPNNFSLGSAFAPQGIGEQDVSEHPGNIYKQSNDPIKETESSTHGAATETVSLAQKIASRFNDMVGDGGDFGALVDSAIMAANLPGVDFDPSVQNTGSCVLGAVGNLSSCTHDPAGASPFTGFRADYRPETAPAGIKRNGLKKHSLAETHIVRNGDTFSAMMAILREIKRSRAHGTGIKNRARPVIDFSD